MIRSLLFGAAAKICQAWVGPSMVALVKALNSDSSSGSSSDVKLLFKVRAGASMQCLPDK